MLANDTVSPSSTANRSQPGGLAGTLGLLDQAQGTCRPAPGAPSPLGHWPQAGTRADQFYSGSTHFSNSRALRSENPVNPSAWHRFVPYGVRPKSSKYSPPVLFFKAQRWFSSFLVHCSLIALVVTLRPGSREEIAIGLLPSPPEKVSACLCLLLVLLSQVLCGG